MFSFSTMFSNVACWGGIRKRLFLGKGFQMLFFKPFKQTTSQNIVMMFSTLCWNIISNIRALDKGHFFMFLNSYLILKLYVCVLKRIAWQYRVWLQNIGDILGKRATLSLTTIQAKYIFKVKGEITCDKTLTLNFIKKIWKTL